MKTNEVRYSYDDEGRRIKKIDGQDYTRIWQYDETNRVIQEKGYSHDKLAYVEDYEYFDAGYQYSATYYDNNGKQKAPIYSDTEFSPIYTSTFSLDNKGRIIKEDITTEKDIKISTEFTYYDSKGRIARTIHRYIDEHFLNANEQPETTHIFEYR